MSHSNFWYGGELFGLVITSEPKLAPSFDEVGGVFGAMSQRAAPCRYHEEDRLGLEASELALLRFKTERFPLIEVKEVQRAQGLLALL